MGNVSSLEVALGCQNSDFGLDFRPGDSGAWIVDDITNEVYGHVVADDVFGRGYIVPIDDTLENIKDRLAIEAVFLPSRTDVLNFKATPATHQSVHPSSGSSKSLSEMFIKFSPINSNLLPVAQLDFTIMEDPIFKVIPP